MALVAMDGTIEYINACAVATFGYQPEDIPHMNDWWLKAYPDAVCRDQVVARWMGLVEKAIAGNGYIEREEYPVTCKNGTLKTMLIFGVLVSGKIFVMFEDISARKTAEKEILRPAPPCNINASRLSHHLTQEASPCPKIRLKLRANSAC